MTVLGGERVVNAEAVALDVRPARLGSRALALGFDICVQAVLALLLLLLISVTLRALPPSWVDDALFDATWRIAVVIVVLGYPTVIETITNGRSLRKMVVGLRVIREDGGPIRVRHAFTRSLVGFAIEWPGLLFPLVTWVVSLGTMLGSSRGRRLGDLAAGTIVVHVRRPYPWLHVPPMPPPLAGWAAVADLSAVSDDLALSVRQYLSRAHLLRDPHRYRLRHELASELSAKVRPAPPPGTPPDAYLAAVLAERRRRAEGALSAGRTLSNQVLLPAESAPSPIRSASPGAGE
ncbi:RDD family protein [Actinoplanes sp. CA-015351]|uniref:RDD family protein n=1 Tax=Actinoplanes sp. CA-015351 TaxID=3239897 RepID=UPI003D97A546